MEYMDPQFYFFLMYSAGMLGIFALAILVFCICLPFYHVKQGHSFKEALRMTREEIKREW